MAERERRGTPIRVLEPPAAERSRDWEATYRDNVTPVYRFIYARTGNRADAEDITAQVFLRALPRLRSDAAEPEVRGYLMTTARTALADFWAQRYAAPLAELHDNLASSPPLPGAGADHSERVTEILERLSEGHRQVLELRFLRGYSIRETAIALGMSVANAKVTQWRALKRAAALAGASNP